MSDCGLTDCFEDAVALNEPCYFCDNKHTIGFKEHYYFCPSCSAIYTFMIVYRKSCEHITNKTPVIERPPWYKEHRKKPYILNNNWGSSRMCSICNKHVRADGW